MQMLGHSFLFLPAGVGAALELVLRDLSSVSCYPKHKPLWTVVGEEEEEGSLGAVQVYQHGDEPSRLLPVSFTKY